MFAAVCEAAALMTTVPDDLDHSQSTDAVVAVAEATDLVKITNLTSTRTHVLHSVIKNQKLLLEAGLAAQRKRNKQIFSIHKILLLKT